MGEVDLLGSVPGVQSDALISECGLYRYWLTRTWSDAPALPIVMLNPSTADASIDDPTIRRCMGFAKREGFGGVRVMNLFAFRATSPDDMKAAADPIGPRNVAHLEKCLARAAMHETPVLLAWGVHGAHLTQDRWFVASSKVHKVPVVCLGTTKDGHPRHPLYVKGDQPFAPFSQPPA